MEENINRNNNKTSKIIIGVLSFIIVVLSVYIVIDKTNILNSKTKVEENKPKEEVIETKKLTQGEADLLIKNIEEVYNPTLLAYVPLNNISEIKNEDLFSLALKSKYYYNVPKEFSKNDLDETIKNYFGSKISINHKDQICPYDKVALYVYDDTTGKYAYNDEHPGHGGPGSLTDNKLLYIDGEIKNNIYTIKAKVFVGKYCKDTCGPNTLYYASYKDATENFNNPIIGEVNSENSFELTKEIMEENKDKVPTTTYTFEKDSNNNFILVSINLESN